MHSLGGHIDWQTIGVFAVVGIVGSLIGNVLSQRVNQQALKRAFAGFLVVMGLFVLGREVPHVLAATRSPTDQSVATQQAAGSLETVTASSEDATDISTQEDSP